jgi:hypothetical protein
MTGTPRRVDGTVWEQVQALLFALDRQAPD